MIAKVPLELKQYFFPFVHVAADPQYEPEKGKDKAHFDVKTAVIKDEKNDLYQVTVEITDEPENENSRIPYSVKLIGVGLFSVTPKWQEPEKLLRINGASIIYSAAREFLITITSRGPWPPVILPAISFKEPSSSKAATDQEE